MSRIVIIVTLAFLLLERAASQAPPQACQDAILQIGTACAGATTICTGACGDAYQAVFSTCSPEFATAQQMAFDQACGTSPTGSTTTIDPAACTQAMSNLIQDQRCSNITTIDISDVTAMDCTACRGLVEAIIGACGSTFPITQAEVNEACGSTGGGGGASALSTLGIYTVLLLSMIAAVIF